MDVRKISFLHEGGETLEQFAERLDGCLTPGNIKSEVVCSFEQQDPVKPVPAYGRYVGLGVH